MKVAIEARALSRPASGITTYVRGLTRMLPSVEPENEYMILEQGPAYEALWPLWLATTVPRWLKHQKPDLVHFTKAALPQEKKFPTVVTIYDVIPILFPPSQKMLARLLWPRVLRHAAQASDHILTISEASKRDIVEYLQVPGEKVTVTPLAVDPSASVSTEAPPLIKGRKAPYILFLSTLEPRKNVPALVRAFHKIAAQIPHQLLIAGRAHKGLGEIEREVSRLSLSDRVKILGAVPQEDLPSLYINADLFVLPSIYEGWSFPSQEAMAAGTPIITSNGGALPEVVGEAGEVVPFTVDSVAARLHDEAFEAALASRMLEVLSNPVKQAQMRERGLAQVKKNSWEQVARTTLDVYHRISQR